MDIIKKIDAFEIQQYQQNRYPCLFIDYVEEAVPGKSAKGYKNWSYNEWFFPNHFLTSQTYPASFRLRA